MTEGPELEPVEPVPIDDTVIQRLESVLEKARRGDVLGVAIATVGRNGRVGYAWSKAPRASSLIGAVSILLTRMNLHQIEDSR